MAGSMLINSDEDDGGYVGGSLQHLRVQDMKEKKVEDPLLLTTASNNKC